MSKKKSKNKKTRKPLSKFEMIFCIISLLLMIGVGIYYGYRSFYYFSKQNNVSTSELKLSDSILNNSTLTTRGDGLHQDEDGYLFKGNVSDNYVKFGNRLFRVIRINNDGSIKVISQDTGATFMWGSETDYSKSNLNSWLDNIGVENSGIYYNTIPNISKFLVKTSYTIDTLNSNKITNGKDKLNSYITTLGIKDYTNALGKDSYLNINKAFWLIGLEDESNLYVSSEGSVETSSTYEAYGVRAVFTFKKNVKVVSGIGTIDNPYIIDQGNDINYVDNYIKLGNDLYKVSLDNGSYLLLYSDDYLKVGDFVKSPFSNNKSSEFSITNKNNIGYYLNNSYLNTLIYRDYLVPYAYKIGEFNLDSDYDYFNIYKDSVNGYVGLLNIFDYYTGSLNDFYYVNNTGDVSSMVYVYDKDGYLNEESVGDSRYMVTTIVIKKEILKSGTGTKDDPYTVS